MDSENSGGRLIVAVIILIILLVTLSFVTFSLVYSVVSVENNIFRTGAVSINLNDGKLIVDEGDSNFAPGMTMRKDFFIENNSTYSVYYKLYFANVEGDMADVIIVNVYNGEQVLYTGTVAKLQKQNVLAADDELKINERRNLTIEFIFPEEAGNVIDNYLRFDICADATQTKNNPGKLFE